MNAKLLTMLLSFPSLMAMAGESKTQLVIWAKDGVKVAYSLDEQPKVTFTEDDLVVMADGIEVNYPLGNMARFTYENDTTSDIVNLQTGNVSAFIDGTSLLFPSLNANSTISLYHLNGTLVFKKTVVESGEYSFPLSSLKPGIYMVSINGLTYKIMKR